MATRADALVVSSLPGGDVKPFTPEEAREIVMSLQKPAVFCNMAFDWPALHWHAIYLAKLLAGKRMRFRIGMKDTGTAPLFETECSYVEATLEEFLAWSGKQPSRSCGPFSGYELCKYWTYADYKYIARLFEDKPENFQVLFVPRHWWHYVESIDPITVSINSWIELDADHEARVEEAITRTLICAIKSAENTSASDSWLNPTEVEVTSHETNLQYVNGAVSAYLEHQKTSKIEDMDPRTEEVNQYPCKRKKVQGRSEPEGFQLMSCESSLTEIQGKKLEKIPFGHNLFQVLPQFWETDSTGSAENDSKGSPNENDEHFGKLHCAGKTSKVIGDSGALVDQKDPGCSTISPQAVICTNDLLDCVLNPQVIRLMAQLLIERASV
ncbi:HSPB1-associated protein 1 isoform X3 [Podarcis raffonei]|uniref:HSPB1-associated protein 1 isoform X3 n=1 Tax=Podarcis raffonei TaxID=65483 RepID=UPI0023297C1C|nr:HSPB1-associated protein 1 isoform X3 [Podarcis raffonei]